MQRNGKMWPILKERNHSIETLTGTHMLEVAEKNFIVAIINMFEDLKENIAKISE